MLRIPADPRLADPQLLWLAGLSLAQERDQAGKGQTSRPSAETLARCEPWRVRVGGCDIRVCYADSPDTRLDSEMIQDNAL